MIRRVRLAGDDEDFAHAKFFHHSRLASRLHFEPVPAARWHADAEIQALVADIHAQDAGAAALLAPYSRAAADALKAASFDRVALGQRDLRYERLDQLTVEVLLGAR